MPIHLHSRTHTYTVSMAWYELRRNRYTRWHRQHCLHSILKYMRLQWCCKFVVAVSFVSRVFIQCSKFVMGLDQKFVVGVPWKVLIFKIHYKSASSKMVVIVEFFGHIILNFLLRFNKAMTAMSMNESKYEMKQISDSYDIFSSKITIQWNSKQVFHFH